VSDREIVNDRSVRNVGTPQCNVLSQYLRGIKRVVIVLHVYVQLQCKNRNSPNKHSCWL